MMPNMGVVERGRRRVQPLSRVLALSQILDFTDTLVAHFFIASCASYRYTHSESDSDSAVLGTATGPDAKPSVERRLSNFMAMNQGLSDAVEHAAICVSCRGDLRTLFSISMLLLPFAPFAALLRRFIGVGSDILQRVAGPELTIK